jgi:hypothetical protein
MECVKLVLDAITALPSEYVDLSGVMATTLFLCVHKN